MRAFPVLSFTCGPVLRQALAAWACLALLSSCSTQSIENFYDSKITPDRPIDWWHQLAGGPVAQVRPPPPGVNDPYPTFAAVPPKPVPLDPATRQSLLTRMLAQRDLARRDSTQIPVVWPVPGVPPSPAAKPAPKPAAAATPAAPAQAARPDTSTPDTSTPDTSTMVFEGAAAPNAQAKPAPTAPTPIDRTPPAGLSAPLGPAAVPVTSGPIPALPTSAPALPNIPGLPIAQPIPPASPRKLPAARIAFAPGSAALPPEAEAALRSLAARRATATVVVHAGGDARSAALPAQQAALPLALQRTGAITAALIAAGVPSAAIRAEAVAEGRDATARLLN